MKFGKSEQIIDGTFTVLMASLPLHIQYIILIPYVMVGRILRKVHSTQETLIAIETNIGPTSKASHDRFRDFDISHVSIYIIDINLQQHQ